MNRPRFDTDPLAQVSTEDGLTPDGLTLVFVKELRHPPAVVWAALTDPARLEQWAPYTSDRDLGTPGEATLTLIDGESKVDLAATVTRAEPPTRLEHSFGDGDRLRWELTPTATGTRLVLRHTSADPSGLAKLAAGWHICLAVAACLLDGDPVGPIRGAAALEHGWTELNDRYASQLDETSQLNETSQLDETSHLEER